MSEPFVKVWASDMRGDPKIALLEKHLPSAPYWLIQAWDLAKNGPVFGELRNNDGSAMKPDDFAAVIPGATRRKAETFYALLLAGTEGRALAATCDDGALKFSKLERRQGNRALSDVRAAAGRKGAESRWQNDGKTDSKVDDKPFTRARASHSQSQSSTLEPLDQPTLSSESGTADQISINAKDIQGETKRAIEYLLAELGDRDAGTAGRLVALARAGATPAEFHDARMGVLTTNSRSPSRVACAAVEASIRIRTGGAA